MTRLRVHSVHLDERTILFLRPNGMFVIRRLHGQSHEHPYLFRSVQEGHVIARGRVRAPSTLVVSRSDLTLPALRKLVEPSGAAYGMKVVKVKRR